MTTVKSDEVRHVEHEDEVGHDRDLKQTLDNFNEVTTIISSNYAFSHNL